MASPYLLCEGHCSFKLHRWLCIALRLHGRHCSPLKFSGGCCPLPHALWRMLLSLLALQWLSFPACVPSCVSHQHLPCRSLTYAKGISPKNSSAKEPLSVLRHLAWLYRTPLDLWLLYSPLSIITWHIDFGTLTRIKGLLSNPDKWLIL